MSKINIMVMSTCSPLYVSKLPDWHYRDAIYRKLVKEHNVQIHVPIPQAGDTKMMERVYNGDVRPLYHTLRDIDIKFYPDIVESIDYEACILEGLAMFQDVEVFGKKISAKEQEEAMFRILDRLVERNKPIVLLDNDYVCTQPFNGDDHFLGRVYNRYKHYNKLGVIASMTEYLEPNVRFKHLPFPLDVTTIREDIKPVEDREYLCRYIGNNYNKSTTHVPVFNTLSKYGKVLINGYRWTQEDKSNAPDAVFKNAVSMSLDNTYNALGNSVLGISGYSPYQRDVYKDLYHYRWKEFLIAGTYIVTENCKELIDMMPKGNLIFDEIISLSDKDLKDKLDYIKSNYINLVKQQRDCCIEWCRVENILPHYLELLEID